MQYRLDEYGKKISALCFCRKAVKAFKLYG